MQFLGYDFCAKVAVGLPLNSCKWYAADLCPNTPPDIQPNGTCGNYTQEQSQGDNFFWNRQP
jgi:hypothetical protein